jgi:thiosulfate reductase cytochrome b subunit
MLPDKQPAPETCDTVVSEASPVEENLETFDLAKAPATLESSHDGTVEAEGRRRRPRLPNTNRQRTSRQPRAHLFVIVCHWGMVVLMALSLLSGMRIGWGYIDSPLGGGSGTWSALLGAIAPTGTLLGINLITLHMALAFFMLTIVGVYVVYIFSSRASRRLQINMKDLRNLGRGLATGNFLRSKSALWSANLLVYWLSFLFIGVTFVTGVLLYRLDLNLLDSSLVRLLGGYQKVRFLHGIVAYLLVPYVIVHMVLQWLFGRFWTIFKAQLYRPHVRAGLVGLAVILPIIGGLYAWNDVPRTLTVTRLPADLQAPVLDGDPSDAAWSRAAAVTIRTVKGINNPRHYVDVMIRALHDGAQIYFQLQWEDPDVSFKRFPLRKTRDGWEVLNTAKEYADENVYYEDKLSMYLTDVRNGSCAATCHLGSGPHSARGEKHGVHYTHGEVGDVWHWKSVRTNDMGALTGEPGFMDDQHFRTPDSPPAELTKRYTAGYHADPKTGGGYRYNYVKLNPDRPLADTSVQPIMLPPRRDIRTNSDPTISEHGVVWWIHTSQGIPYSEAADDYPVGALIPNILIEPFQGDRADVRAKAAWHQGRWTLEVRRVLDTGSQYDVAFTSEKPVYITVATYNRSQTRHSEHIRPIRLVLQP